MAAEPPASRCTTAGRLRFRGERPQAGSAGWPRDGWRRFTRAGGEGPQAVELPAGADPAWALPENCRGSGFSRQATSIRGSPISPLRARGANHCGTSPRRKGTAGISAKRSIAPRGRHDANSASPSGGSSSLGRPPTAGGQHRAAPRGGETTSGTLGPIQRSGNHPDTAGPRGCRETYRCETTRHCPGELSPATDDHSLGDPLLNALARDRDLHRLRAGVQGSA